DACRQGAAAGRCARRHPQGPRAGRRRSQAGRSRVLHELRDAVAAFRCRHLMSQEKILDQAEIDALIHGVDTGAVSTEAPPAPGEARSYDFNSQSRIVRGRMPTLEMINERFARLNRVSLYNLLRRSPEISVGAVEIKKFSEYVHTLHVPTSLNLVKINPFRGTALIVLDPKM